MEVVKRIRELPGLDWRGILVYPGHIMGTASTRPGLIREENRLVSDLIDLLTAAGIPCPVVSGGNTPAAYASHEFTAVTEIRPGPMFSTTGTLYAPKQLHGPIARLVY